jgi:tRNA threonylcarbamoyladenosine biosynthesis protein TsaE
MMLQEEVQREIASQNEGETIEFGKNFSRQLAPGDVVAMFGDLGSGKTRFVKGVCAGVGVRVPVTSPTFTIVNEYYGGRVPIYHFDFYRLRTAAELDEIGFDEYVAGNGVCLVEWADIVQEKLPPYRYDVSLKLGATRDVRIIQIRRTK